MKKSSCDGKGAIESLRSAFSMCAALRDYFSFLLSLPRSLWSKWQQLGWSARWSTVPYRCTAAQACLATSHLLRCKPLPSKYTRICMKCIFWCWSSSGPDFSPSGIHTHGHCALLMAQMKCTSLQSLVWNWGINWRRHSPSCEGETAKNRYTATGNMPDEFWTSLRNW